MQEHDIDLFLHLRGMNVKDFAFGVQQLSALHTSNPHIAFLNTEIFLKHVKKKTP